MNVNNLSKLSTSKSIAKSSGVDTPQARHYLVSQQTTSKAKDFDDIKKSLMQNITETALSHPILVGSGVGAVLGGSYLFSSKFFKKNGSHHGSDLSSLNEQQKMLKELPQVIKSGLFAVAGVIGAGGLLKRLGQEPLDITKLRYEEKKLLHDAKNKKRSYDSILINSVSSRKMDNDRIESDF